MKVYTLEVIQKMGEVLFRWEPEFDKNKKMMENIADEYIVISDRLANSGIIVFARYGQRWEPNPFCNRPIIAQLLKHYYPPLTPTP